MRKVIVLGPIPTHEGDGFVSVLIGEGEPAEPAQKSGANPLGCLRAWAEALGAEEFAVGPELRAEAAELRIPVREHSPEVAKFRALIGVALTNPTALQPYVVELIIDAAARLDAAAPWRWLDSDTPVDVSVETGRGRPLRFEGSVLGSDGQVFGFALHPRLGASARMRRSRAADGDGLALIFDEEPGWVREAVREAFGIDRIPRAIKTRDGEAIDIAEDEADLLAAVVDVVADLEPERRECEGEIDLDEELSARIVARVRPEPRAVAPAAAKIPRNAPCPCGSGRKYKRCCMAE